MNIPFLSLHDVTALHGDEINAAVTREVNSDERFEKDNAHFIGSDYCIGCANGLDALIWIFKAYMEMGVMKSGDEVIAIP